MSFLGVKVILFLVIPLIIKEKSNASALVSTVPHVHNGRYEHAHRPFHVFITVDTRQLSHGFAQRYACFCLIFRLFSGIFSYAFV